MSIKLNASTEYASVEYQGTVRVAMYISDGVRRDLNSACTVGYGGDTGGFQAEVWCEIVDTGEHGEFEDPTPALDCHIDLEGAELAVTHRIPLVYEPVYGIEPFDLTVGFSAKYTIPYDTFGTLENETLESPSTFADNWPAARCPNGLIEQNVTIERTIPSGASVLCEVSIGEESDSSEAEIATGDLDESWGHMLFSNAFAADARDPSEGEWGVSTTCTFARTGFPPVQFGSHDYYGDVNECKGVEVSGDEITTYVSGHPDGPLLWLEALNGAYTTEASGRVQYCDGKLIDASLTLPEAPCTWNPATKTWDLGVSTPVTSGTDEQVSYDGSWKLLFDAAWSTTGDYNDGGTVIVDDTNCDLRVGDVGYEARTRTHGPLTVEDVDDLGQPEFTTYGDRRVMLDTAGGPLGVTDAVSVTVDASASKDMIEFPWSAQDHLVLSDPADFTLASNANGIAVTCNNAEGYIEFAYDEAELKAADWFEHWLGVRYANFDITGTTGDFTVTIAGRTYKCSTDKPRIDLLAFEEALPSPATQSLLPTFLPRNTVPPTITDIPKDWGVYKPGTIRLSGFTAGASYVFERIFLERLTDVETKIFHEPQWEGWNASADLDAGEEGVEIFFAGTDAADLDYYAQRQGYVLVDGVVAFEIIAQYFRRDASNDWDLKYCLLAGSTGETSGYMYAEAIGGAVASTVFVTIDQDDAVRPIGYGLQTGEDVPVGYLEAGNYTGDATIDAVAFQWSVTVPGNFESGIVLQYEKNYGALALVRVANPNRITGPRSVGIAEGCEGAISKATDDAGVCFTWGDDAETEMLSQFNEGFTQHEFTLNVLDGELGSFTGESRNRALAIGLIQSAWGSTPVAENPLSLRIHSYSVNPQYDFDFEYYRNAAWTSLKTRVLSDRPISITKAYKEIYTAALTLNNEDGLLTPENETSAYNLNGATYEALIEESRKVRLKQGVSCYSQLTAGLAASIAPTAGAVASLTDGVIADDETDETDAAWVHWSAVAADADLVLTAGLADPAIVRHGVISFLSKTNATPQIMLPSFVKWEYSVDGETWYPIKPNIFKMRPGTDPGNGTDFVDGEAEAEYKDARVGQRYLAWFTDLDKTAEYVRATIRNIGEENEIYIEDFAVWGGTTTTAIYETTFTGYLGDSILVDNDEGIIELQFQDTRKREADNRSIELTRLYENMRPEEIIYDLLASQGNWSYGINIVRNGTFEAATDWTYVDGASRVQGDGGFWPKPYDGLWCVELDNLNLGSEEGCYQEDILVEGGKTYQIEAWYYAPNDGSWKITVTPDVGDPESFPTTGYYSETANLPSYQRKQVEWIAPANATKCTLRFDRKQRGVDGEDYSDNFAIDAVQMCEVTTLTELNQGVPASEIGWSAGDNLSGFVVTKWQGQQGTVLDYINELAALVGWVYDADGDGVRQFYQPEESRLTPETYLAYFGDRWGKRGTIKRTRTGAEIRNHIKVVGYEANNAEVPREYRHKASIAIYGDRYARITEPLVKTAEISNRLGKALLRDFAYGNHGVSLSTYGDFDCNLPKKVCTFHEPIRALLDKDEMWAVDRLTTEMVAAGRGKFTMAVDAKRYVSGMPDPVADIAGTGADVSIVVAWTANTETDMDGYYVYWSTSATGPFTKRAKVTAATDTITGLTNATGYWFYVTAVNLEGIESEPSALVYCLAGVGNTGTEATTWGIADLAAALVASGDDVLLTLSWTPSLQKDPDYISASLRGPYTTDTPTQGRAHGHVAVADGVAATWYATYAKADYAAATTYYWKLAISEVVIGDAHYHFGSELLSNVASDTWPS